MTLKERIGYYFPQVKNGDFIKSISATGLKTKQQQQNEYLPFMGMSLNWRQHPKDPLSISYRKSVSVISKSVIHGEDRIFTI